VVRNIVAAMPADTILAVKEHRVQAGWRDPAFYEELMSIPGVVLIHDSVDTRNLIRAADAVFTLTGTASLEAMCLGTPAIVFGEIYYQGMPGVRRVRSVPELREVLGELDSFQRATDEEVHRAFAARHVASCKAGWRSGGRTPGDTLTTAQALLANLPGHPADATRATTA
jgi:capsule polysaccharide export protein KpsC/LpsZ